MRAAAVRSFLSVCLVAAAVVLLAAAPISARRSQQSAAEQSQLEELEDAALLEFASDKGAWIGSNNTVSPVTPAQPPAEPKQQPVNPSAAAALSTRNNNATESQQKNPGFIKEMRFDPASRERRAQPRRVVSDSPAEGEVSVQNYTSIFNFVQSQTSEGYTLATKEKLSIEQLAEACSKDVRCTGFTSTGELKSFVRPASKWVALDVSASASVNTDASTAGIYYLPQWYRFQPVPCPCGAEVQLNFVCSDPNSGDQYLGDPLTDASCYRAKPAPVSHSCSARTCVPLAWKTLAFDKCPSCGVNITVTRKVQCVSTSTGSIYPGKFCALKEPRPASKQLCDKAVACEWNSVEGACNAPCGRGFRAINVTCQSPVDNAVVPDVFCPSVKPRSSRKCKEKECVWSTVENGKCSFACGPGHKQLKATCIEASKPDVALPEKQCRGLKKPASLIKCNNRPCGWDTKPVSPCSQPCGRGQQQVLNTCKDPLSGDVMPSKQCGADPPASFQYCSLRRCEWQTAPFGQCSTTCGSGTQYFNVTCRDPATSHRVDDAQCKGVPPPAPSAPCANNACGWRARPIGECSASCGSGTQRFNVTCEDPITGALVDEKTCGEHKPNATQACHVRECHWHRASKGKCSSPCGPGIQAYTLSCRNPDDGQKQPKKQCKNIPVPALSEPCFLHACEWHAQNDGKCSQLCGPGRQKRTISCHDPVTSVRVPSEHCTGKAPSKNTKCYAQACVWATKPTSQCSASCGPGTQSVNVTCTDPHHRFVLPNSQCFDASRPNATQPCNLQDCKWKVTPASSCSHSCGRGTQRLTVACKDPLTNQAQPEAQCDEEAKPKDSAKCFLKPCAWVSDPPVSKCSESCGPGHVAVNVTCQDAQLGTVYPDALCRGEGKKPSALQPCQIAECVWKNEFSECGKSCGGDFQYANQTCVHPDSGETMSNTQCKASPPAWKQCATQACLPIGEAFLTYNFEHTITVGAKVPNRSGKAKRVGLDGVVMGSGASSVVGRGGKGKAISFPSSGDHTSGPSIIVPKGRDLTSPSFSLSFWLQLLASPTPGRFYILVDNRGTKGGGEGFVVYLDPRDGLLYLNDAYSAQQGKSHFADSGVAFPQDGEWHHVALTYNEKLVRFYLDGKQSSVVDPSHAFRFTVAISQHTVHLRGSPDKYWRVLPLALDNFAYFAYPLKAEQVAVLADVHAKNPCEAGKKLTAGGCSKFRNPGDALNGRCAAGAPYSLEQCLQPLWGLHKCSTLGSSYPSAGDAALWNSKSWKEIKSTVASFRARDKEPQLLAKKSWGVCRNRTPSGLDHLCDHPPPYHTSVCLQGLFLESGCSRKAAGFPASASHPLTVQLNQLSWRDVKAKMQHIITTDVRGGASEGMCHDAATDMDTQ